MKNNSIRLIFVEDNTDLRDEVTFQLEENGINVVAVSCAEEMSEALSHSVFDIAILDIGLPTEDGVSIAQRLRQNFPRMGIIMMTAIDQINSRITSLESGADIYLTKPIELRELLAHISSLSRRLSVNVSHVDLDSWVLQCKGRELITPYQDHIFLTHTESIVMTLLARASGDAVSRDSFISAIVGKQSLHYDPHRLEVCVSRIRNKMLKTIQQHSIHTTIKQLPLKTSRGVGYVFSASIKIK